MRRAPWPALVVPGLAAAALVIATTLGRFGIDDAFITKLNASGSSLSYSTFVGSTGTEGVSAIALDSTGSASRRLNSCIK